MAQVISIGASHHIDLLKVKLGQEIKLFEGDGIKVQLEESPAGKFTFLSCRVSSQGACHYTEEDTQVIFRHYVADIISDIILNQWEYLLLKNIIRENYYYFGEEDKKLIYDYALRHVNREGEYSTHTIYWLSRKSRILQKLLEFLRTNNKIIIDGFIRFRLKEYINELRDAADKAVDDFLMEREYREFIQLLKYFVEYQEPKVELVHVMIKAGGVFKLFDENNQSIKSEYLEGFIMDLVDSEINYEDLLISALITIAPKKITLHYKNDGAYSATLETIRNVFTGRVSECAGCNFCSPILKS